VSSKRLVSLARSGHAATDLSVILLDTGRSIPEVEIGIRSGLRVDQIPPGFHLDGQPGWEVIDGQVVLHASYVDAEKRSVTVWAWHRLVKDDGRGDVQLVPGSSIQLTPVLSDAGVLTKVQGAGGTFGVADGGTCAVDLIFIHPRRGTRYTVEKVVNVVCSVGELASPSTPRFRRSFGLKRQRTSSGESDGRDVFDAPPMLLEVEEEHRSAWKTEWDQADIEIIGARRAARCQRVVRLYRFHQVSRGDAVGSGKKAAQVSPLVSQLFQAAFEDLCDDQRSERPSALITSRVIVQDPRATPVLKIDPKMPTACRRLRFNASLGSRWHRFTFTPGTVKILVQGRISHETDSQLYGEIVTVPPRFIVMCDDRGNGVEVKALPWHEVQVQHALTELGRPDGSTGGFYGLIRRTRFTRVEVVRRLLAEGGADWKDETLQLTLRNALSRLASAPRPPGWRTGDNDHIHLLEADATTRTRVLLAYEKTELTRDITFLHGRFQRHEGQLMAGEDLLVETMTIREAESRCNSLPGCRGFTFQGEPTEEPVKIHFKDMWDVQGSGWTSYQYEDGETALSELLRSRYEAQFRDSVSSCRMEPWSVILDTAERALDAAVASSEVDGEKRSKPFRNFITDRDGTTNNYCDRYSSCVQSAYNAAWLCHFAQHCTENALVVTAAPLGGRPSAEGLMELCVAPRGVFTYTGSKGREYFNPTAQRVFGVEVLPKEQRELVEELHRRLLALCAQPGNTKFLGIGSGLQRKFGEVTMGRNDPAGTVPDQESRRFMAAVRRVKEELDPDGTALDVHDTGTDLEIFPRAFGSRESFDKGSGVKCLDEKLQLNIAEGPNLICGDTSSDVPMIVAVLELMCGEHMIRTWQEVMNREENPDEPLPDEVCNEAVAELTSEELEQRAKDEAERLARAAEEERIAQEAGSKIVVLFVVTPEQHEKTPTLSQKVRRWCELSGAHCAILPSCDVLVATLRNYANKVAGRRVTDPLETTIANGFSITRQIS